MTREDVLKLFPEATDEQITALINQNNSEVVREKEKTEKLKADAKKAEELQKKLDEMESDNLSEIEKANKEKEAALNSVSDLQKQLNEMTFRTKLADKGIAGEQAEGIVKSFFAGDFEAATNSISQIVTERETAAAAAKEQEILKNTPNPGGNSPAGTDGNEKKPADVENIEKIPIPAAPQKAQEAQNYYK